LKVILILKEIVNLKKESSFLCPLRLSADLSNQFAIRPTGSTTAALVNLLHHLTSILENQKYAHVISLDFSKAFDVARHGPLFEKLSDMQLPDPVYHWLVDFFRCRSHCTKFGAVTSPPLVINSIVVQGSALGPPLFILALSDLRAKTPGNFYMKYTDDVTMIVPASNFSSIPAELENVGDWSRMNNQSLNVAKSTEMVVSSRWTRDLVQPPPIPGVARVDTLLLFGVVIDRYLLFSST